MCDTLCLRTQENHLNAGSSSQNENKTISIQVNQGNADKILNRHINTKWEIIDSKCFLNLWLVCRNQTESIMILDSRDNIKHMSKAKEQTIIYNFDPVFYHKLSFWFSCYNSKFTETSLLSITASYLFYECCVFPYCL